MHCTVRIILQGCARKYQHHKSAEKSAKYLGRKAMICNGNWSEDYDEYKKMTHLVLENSCRIGIYDIFTIGKHVFGRKLGKIVLEVVGPLNPKCHDRGQKTCA